MKKTCCYLLLVIIFILHLSSPYAQKKTDYTPFVDPFIGTGGHGHTYPGAVVPFGMVQLSPDTRLTGWDGCSGYYYTDTVVYGFSHTHLSGTGDADYCDILFMPTTGEPKFNNTVYCSGFKKKNELASPGYYKTHLDKYNGTLQDTGSSIIFPPVVEYQVSNDGKNYRWAATLNTKIGIRDSTVQTQNFTAILNINARYIKVIAKQYGISPEWHENRGDPSFIFTDEIIVE